MAISIGVRLGLLCTGVSMLALAASAGGAAAAPTAARPGLRIDPVPPERHAHAVPGSGSPWQEVAHQPSFNPGAMFLLTDGTVLVQNGGPKEGGTNKWWRLAPNAAGSYVNGTWRPVASMPSNYGPLYYSSAVLPDGQFVVMGGEYNFGKAVETNLGAIYNPVRNTWFPVPDPSGSEWSNIGDAPGAVLPNGTFMIGASGFSGDKAEALFNEARLSWRGTGRGKVGSNGEQGWSLLPNGKLLTVDTIDHPGEVEFYTPSTGSWKSAGKTPVNIVDKNGEIGPQILRPDGTVLAVGATGSNAIYNTATGKWSGGPRLPLVNGKRLDVADGPAAVLPDGDVLIFASPGEYKPRRASSTSTARS